jgi:RecA-family ATPase
MTPKIWNARELITTDFPDPVWIIPGMIPEGLMILAGKPKVGKSWLALCLALSVAHGRYALGQIPLESSSGVLYLALEDSEARLKSRLQTLSDETMPDGLDFCTEWLRGEEGCQALQEYLGAHPHVKLVIIDVWQKFRSAKSGRGRTDQYVEAYDEFTQLLKISKGFHIAIIILTHAKKDFNPDGDWIDAVLGSTGASGAADTIALLTKIRGQADAVIKMTGRDLQDDIELALSRDDHSAWNIMGDATEFQITKQQGNILAALKAVYAQKRTPVCQKEVIAYLGFEQQSKEARNVRFHISALARRGLIQSPAYGKYSPIEKTESTECTRSAKTSGSTGSLLDDALNE